MWPFRRTPFQLIEPGQDPTDVQPAKFRIESWHLVVLFGIGCIMWWFVFNKPGKARADMVTETPPAQLEAVTSTPEIHTATVTLTPTLPTPPTAISIIRPVEVTRVVRETVIVPQVVNVPVEVTRIVDREVTREVYPPVDLKPDVTSTPWIIVITQPVEVTRIVLVTSTPTETPSPTATETPTLEPTATETPTLESTPTETPTP